MTLAPMNGTREGQNVYGDTYVSGAAHVHLGNVYTRNNETRDDIENDKKGAKEGE